MAYMSAIKEAMLGDQPFDGITYVASRDQARLSGQLAKVRSILADRQWHTLEELAEKSGGSVASASARIRDLRKAKFGSSTIDRKYFTNGVWHYRMA